MVAILRKKAILIPLDPFTYWIWLGYPARFNMMTTITSYFRKLTDLYSARLGIYVRCDFVPQSPGIPKTFESLVSEAQKWKLEKYSYVAFVSQDYISHPQMPDLFEGFNWADLNHKICFVKFEKEQWEMAGLRRGLDPFQSAILYGNIWQISHEMGHLIGWDLGGYNHGVEYTVSYAYRFYDELFDIVENPDWNKINWSYIAEEMPPVWFRQRTS